MSTMVLDIAGPIAGLRAMERAAFGEHTIWEDSLDPQQQRFINQHHSLRGSVERFPGIECEVSGDYEVLNKFLASKGYADLKLERFRGLGVVALVDLAYKWLKEARLNTLYAQDGNNYPSFVIPSRNGSRVLRNGGLRAVNVRTQDNLTVWFVPVDQQPADGMDLAETALRVLGMHWSPVSGYDVGVNIPMLDLRARADLSFMLGMEAYTPQDGYHQIIQAMQIVRIRMNQFGGRSQSGTAIATARGIPRYFELDQPFVTFVTQGESDFPICTAYADFDSWSDPGVIEGVDDATTGANAAHTTR